MINKIPVYIILRHFKLIEKEKFNIRDIRIFRIWEGMRNRCKYKCHAMADYYLNKGIKVCDKWDNSFISFLLWACKNGYKDDLSIERINVNGDYCPENCKWANSKEQSRNRTDNVILSAFGESKIIADWAEDTRCKVNVDTLYRRYYSGWSAEKIITTPSKNNILKITVWGETKNLSEWSKDIRCKVNYDTLRDRILKGWKEEIAISKAPLKNNGEHKSFRGGKND